MKTANMDIMKKLGSLVFYRKDAISASTEGEIDGKDDIPGLEPEYYKTVQLRYKIEGSDEEQVSNMPIARICGVPSQNSMRSYQSWHQQIASLVVSTINLHDGDDDRVIIGLIDDAEMTEVHIDIEGVNYYFYWADVSIVSLRNLTHIYCDGKMVPVT